ncbi:MAG: F0F1 ATP synthase subunit beta, partial [Rhodobacterales bacterium CG_4_10_14_0_8_um_filter_70_9]
VPLAETLAGCRAILDGATDDWSENALYMVGTFDDARRKELAAVAADGRDAEAA